MIPCSMPCSTYSHIFTYAPMTLSPCSLSLLFSFALVSDTIASCFARVVNQLPKFSHATMLCILIISGFCLSLSSVSVCLSLALLQSPFLALNSFSYNALYSYYPNSLSLYCNLHFSCCGITTDEPTHTMHSLSILSEA